ncbi:MAG: SDR family NAD(P)-dependent oxidoreductase [Ardenticatenaceae bacterium]|nr:SDR family NAD(P)-dependent oxidoreductase [Ardenticatenaceae bacterium]
MKQRKKTVIITGGNSGLGYQGALQLAREGDWHIVIASRNEQRVSSAVEQLKRATNYPFIEGMLLDLGSLQSVRRFAKAFKAADLPPLHAIVGNAGLSPAKNSTTADGIDTIFGVNHLGHFLLIHLLADVLESPARVVLVSSGTHLPDHPFASKMGVPPPKYVGARFLAHPEEAPAEAFVRSPAQRYSTSKLCNVLFGYELSRQFSAIRRDISVFALDPGLMPGTGLVRDLPSVLQAVFVPVIGFASRWVDNIRFPEESGRDLVRLVIDPTLDGQTAIYFDGRRPVKSSPDSYDREKAADLWNTSSTLCNLASQETILPLVVKSRTS